MTTIRIRALMVLGCLIAVCPTKLEAVTIVRQHLDAGRVQFSGMDINGDEFPDSIRLDNIDQRLHYFVGDARKNLRRLDPATLPEEERRFVPDVLMERDLDGDEIKDLLLYNRGYLLKYIADDRVFTRLLTGSIFIGQPQGIYIGLSASGLGEEVKKAIIEKARKVVHSTTSEEQPERSDR